jgi:hypothetical protein
MCEQSGYSPDAGLLVCTKDDDHGGRHYDDEKRRHFDA